jgi:hypothetical protein
MMATIPYEWNFDSLWLVPSIWSRKMFYSGTKIDKLRNNLTVITICLA